MSQMLQHLKSIFATNEKQKRKKVPETRETRETGSRARNVNEMKKIMVMIKTISNTFIASASTTNKSSIVRKYFDIL